MKTGLFLGAGVALILNGAIFGFFYAWVCSTMWGLDKADPSVAIAAMQAMNASVRNAVFAPAFFGAPVVLLVTCWIAYRTGRRAAAAAFGGACAVYLFGGLIVTVLVNLPMNQTLADIRLPLDPEEAQAIWLGYSVPWQNWNIARASFSGMALLLTGYGIFRLGRDEA